MAGRGLKGYNIAACFGEKSCPNAANQTAPLEKEIKAVFERENILGFLQRAVQGPLRAHHEFRVSLCDCANACSRPQIADIGIIGAVSPGISDRPCTCCGNCVDICDETAVTLRENIPIIDHRRCLMCGKCVAACPTGTLTEAIGYRVMLGGRLGRHPRLAMETGGIHTHEQVLAILHNCLKFYKKTSIGGQRFSHILTSVDQVLFL